MLIMSLFLTSWRHMVVDTSWDWLASSVQAQALRHVQNETRNDGYTVFNTGTYWLVLKISHLRDIEKRIDGVAVLMYRWYKGKMIRNSLEV